MALDPKTTEKGTRNLIGRTAYGASSEIGRFSKGISNTVPGGAFFVRGVDLFTLPPNPSIGDAYLMAEEAAGEYANALAVWHGIDWSLFTPKVGDTVIHSDTKLIYRFNGAAWAEPLKIDILELTISDPPTQAEVQGIFDILNLVIFQLAVHGITDTDLTALTRARGASSVVGQALVDV